VVHWSPTGALVHDPEFVTFESAGVSVQDFGAQVYCQAPDAPAGVLWDCGFAFRDDAAGQQYRLVVRSDGAWTLSIDDGEAIQSGQGPALGYDQELFTVISLFAIGDKGYFGVDGEYVATLDLSAIVAPGNIAAGTSFAPDTYIEGASTAYQDFIVWSFDDAAPDAPPAADDLPGDLTDVAGNTYANPTYGYSLTWDDSWSVEDVPASEGDMFELSNGTVIADLYWFEWDGDATSCNDDIIAYLQSDSHYSNVEYVTLPNGDPMVTPGEDIAAALISYTYTDDEGQVEDWYDYALCVRLPDSQTFVQLEQYVAPADFAAQLDEMETLQGELMLGPNLGILPPGLPE
jgi:hypothetical protein